MKPMHPVFAITSARLREFIRRPEAVFWVYFFPILMVIVLGFAFRNKPVEQFEVDVLKGPAAEQIVEKLSTNEQLKVNLIEEDEIRDRLRTGKTTLVIKSGEALDQVDYSYDPARPGSTVARYIVDEELQRSLGRKDAIVSVDTIFKEQGSSYVDFLVPGLLGMALMGGGLWGVGFAIVDMRIRKLLKRFMATPMKRSHFLLGMMCSRLIFMIPQVIILFSFAYFFFGVKVHGNWFSLLFIVLIGAVEFAAIGLLVASRAQTLETASGLMNLVMLPLWTLSGIFFSYERFPEVVQPLIKLLPLTPLIDALRAITMDGKPLTSLWMEITVMGVWIVIPFALALAIFRWND